MPGHCRLLFLGYDAVIEPGEDGTYRVYSGSFEKLDNAAKMEQTLRKAGFSTYRLIKGTRKTRNVNLYTFCFLRYTKEQRMGLEERYHFMVCIGGKVGLCLPSVPSRVLSPDVKRRK